MIACEQPPPTAVGRPKRRPSAFTLVELLVVMSLIALLASSTLFAMYGVLEDAKEMRTKAVIAKLNELLLTRWEEYQTRPVPIRIPPRTSPRAAARLRLRAVRELMRMELPERKTDLTDTAFVLLDPSGRPNPPSLWKTYRRHAQAMSGLNWTTTWSVPHQGAECLYLIVSAMRDGDTSALDFFRGREVGDTDGDGMLEILDGWGKPIEFLRWAPGFHIDAPGGVSTMQVRNADIAPDPFDPLKADPHWRYPPYDPNNPNGPDTRPYALFPLIFSAGRDQEYEIVTDETNQPLRYSQTRLPPPLNGWYRNDPYYALPFPNVILMGTPMDVNGDGYAGYQDNITNHLLDTSG